MQKTLITLVMIVFSFNGYTQSKFSIFKVSSGPWDEFYKEFRLSENYVNLTGEINSNVIRISDRVNSTYFLNNHEVSRDDWEMRIDSWDGTDERGRTCKILLGKNKRGSDKSISIIYGDYVFTYFIYY